MDPLKDYLRGNVVEEPWQCYGKAVIDLLCAIQGVS